MSSCHQNITSTKLWCNVDVHFYNESYVQNVIPEYHIMKYVPCDACSINLVLKIYSQKNLKKKKNKKQRSNS